MAARAMWTGQLRLSLVSFGVRMFAATESAGRVSMNQLHEGCHQRLKQQMMCPVHGPVNRDEIVKGYEYEKGSYVIIEPDDLKAIRLESTKTIDLKQFVDASEIDPLYINSPYFLGPDGPVAEEAFRVIREALERSNKVGIGSIVLQGREHAVVVQPRGRGFLMSTLRYVTEVRDSKDIFSDITIADVDEEQVALAETIINSKTSEFDPSNFKDHYRDAFMEIVKTKVEGQEPVIVDESEAAPTAFNFMDALKESVAQAESGGKKTQKKPAAKSVGKTSKSKSKKKAG